MTNTAATVFAAATSGFTGAFDGVMAIAVSVLTVSIIFALVKSMMPHRVRAK